MRMQISKLHLGRYRLDMIDDDTGQIMRGYDCGSAGIIIALTEWIFRDEAAQYQRDQKSSSDQIGRTIIDDMKANPDKYLQPKFPTLPNGRVDIKAMNQANCPDVEHGGREEDCQDNDEGA